MMKKIFISVLLFAAAAAQGQEYFSRFSPSSAITLESAIRLGLENNTHLLSVGQSILIAEQRVRESSMMRLPQFDLLATATAYDLDYTTVLPEAMGLRVIGPQKGSSSTFYGATFSAVQYLYSGGRISGAVKLAKAQLKEEKSKYETEKNRVILNVKISFYNLLYADRMVKLAEKNYETARAYAKKINSKNGWGSVAASAAVEKFRGELSSANQASRRAYRKMLESLNKELNSEIKILGDFNPSFYNNELSKLTLWAMQFRPELKTALYEVEMYNIYTNMSINQKYPDVLLGASFEKVGENTLVDNNKQISLAVRLPLLYSIFTQPKQKKAQQKQSALRRSDLEDTIRRQVMDNFDNFDFWQKEVKDRETSVDVLSKEIKRSETGGVYTVDSLYALEAYHKASAAYLEAVRENLVSKANLEWAVSQDL